MTTAIPGPRGTEHFGMTVPKLDDALAFFHDVMGAEVVCDVGPYRAEDDWMTFDLVDKKRVIIPKAP
ncbi:MAG: hypothetical protein R8G34_09010 [Paracoccaceae bacterium]|nr:hypothetical protein [Paracoccaceae bacterium]